MAGGVADMAGAADMADVAAISKASIAANRQSRDVKSQGSMRQEPDAKRASSFSRSV
jgi:hypothetical protein